MRKFIIKTLGCKTNQVESALMAEILVNNNYIEINNIKEADYYIINSCSVTHIADKKNLAYIKHALIHCYAYALGDRQDNHLEHCMCRLMMAYCTDCSSNFKYEEYVPEGAT